MRLKQTNETIEVRVYNWSNRLIDTVTRTVYLGYAGTKYVKYKGTTYPVKETNFSEGLRYNIWTSER